MAGERKFQVVEETPDEPRSGALDSAATNAILLALKTLSQRAIAALADLFTLLTVFSAWWLWAATPDPTHTQIVHLSIYALFILAANVIVRRT